MLSFLRPLLLLRVLLLQLLCLLLVPLLHLLFPALIRIPFRELLMFFVLPLLKFLPFLFLLRVELFLLLLILAVLLGIARIRIRRTRARHRRQFARMHRSRATRIAWPRIFRACIPTPRIPATFIVNLATLSRLHHSAFIKCSRPRSRSNRRLASILRSPQLRI